MFLQVTSTVFMVALQLSSTGVAGDPSSVCPEKCSDSEAIADITKKCIGEVQYYLVNKNVCANQTVQVGENWIHYTTLTDPIGMYNYTIDSTTGCYTIGNEHRLVKAEVPPPCAGDCANISYDCRPDGTVDIYLVFKSPVTADCLKAAVESIRGHGLKVEDEAKVFQCAGVREA